MPTDNKPDNKPDVSAPRPPYVESMRMLVDKQQPLSQQDKDELLMCMAKALIRLSS